MSEILGTQEMREMREIPIPTSAVSVATAVSEEWEF